MQVIDVPPRAAAQWIRQAWKMFWQQPTGWLLLVALWMILSFAVAVVIPWVGIGLSRMLQPVIFASFMLACRDQTNGKPVQAQHFFGGFRLGQENLRALLMVGAVTLLAETLLGLMRESLGIPQQIPQEAEQVQLLLEQLDGKWWIIFLSLALALLMEGILWFTTPLLAFRAMSASHAIRWSFYAFLSNFAPMLIFGLLMCVIFTLGLLPWGLGMIVVLPLFAISNYTSFRDVFTDVNNAQDEAAAIDTRA